jgi:hypothetical protein
MCAVQECGLQADERAQGWRAYRGDLAEEGDPPYLVFYCPVCAERQHTR